MPRKLDLSSLSSNATTEMGAVTLTEAMHWTWFILLSLATWFAGDLLRVSAYLFQAAWHGTWEIKLPVTGKLLADSPMDYLLFTAMHSKKPVMLSMNDRKVYVGYVAACAEPSQNGGAYQEVTLVPMMSGYRDEKSLKISITTYYEDAKSPLSSLCVRTPFFPQESSSGRHSRSYSPRNPSLFGSGLIGTEVPLLNT